MDQNDKKPEQNGNELSFAELLAQNSTKSERLEPGQKIKATIIKISADWVFLNLGRKDEGYLAKKELLDQDGTLKFKEGEAIEAYFLSADNNELLFTTKIGGNAAGQASLEEAYHSGIPVEGCVEREIKGGYEIKIGSSFRGFCPFSQMGLQRIEDTNELIGKHLPFKITEYSAKGRNIVVSHRAILEEERQTQRAALKEELEEGMTVQGTITSIQNFGAFVNIGAIEGLLPVSEIGWGRVEVRDVLTVGQQVQVVITKLDWENNRFSFSLKDTLPDPWDNVIERYPEGSSHLGKVARVAPFGAFVTLAPGIDGLLHVSKLGKGRRIKHAREAIQEGETVEVKVEAVDREKKQISLSLMEASRTEDQEKQEYNRFLEDAPKSMGTLGDILKARFTKK